MDFVNRLTPEAEDMNHHPDLEISWNKVTVTVTTHSEGGLTDNDFELARRIDSVRLEAVGPSATFAASSDERRRTASK